jgi:hypothetical protein
MTTQQPRIYTYKITFEGAPFWYWGVHKEERYGECYFGSPKTRKWVWDFYEPEIQILEFFPYTDEGWEEACEVEKRLIRPDLNDPNCLNENAAGYFSLEVIKKIHAEKDGDGKSLHAKKAAAAAHAVKDEDGKSVNAKKAAAASHKVIHAEKDEDGKSVTAKKAGAAAKLACQKKVELTEVSDGGVFVFDSCWGAARDLGLDQGTLSQVCLGKRKTHKGYTARYLPG